MTTVARIGSSWLAPIFSCIATAAIAQAPPPPASDVVAIVGERVILRTELDALATGRLARIRNDEYAVRRQVLDEAIGRVLLEQEAGARRMSVEDLTRLEVDTRVAPVTDEQARAVFDSQPSRFGARAFAEVAGEIRTALLEGRTAEARRQLVADLRTRSRVRVLLEAPRVTVNVDAGPSKGPADAPVTIVEFADFQCPYCRDAVATLARLQAAFPTQVRLVFRDFPLPMHADAPRAAEAAGCADEQGRFWEMHDALFAGAVRREDLARRAADAGLDAARFQACLTSGRQQTRWQSGRALGLQLGVSATPTFFVNGRAVTGALPYQAFHDLIVEELDRLVPTSVTTAAPDRGPR